MDKQDKITFIGDGAWGTALSLVLASSGRSSTIWGHDPAYLDTMRETRGNSLFLPGIKIPDAVMFEADLEKAVAGADIVVNAVPSKFLRSVFSGKKSLFTANQIVVSLTKGIEEKTLKRPSEIIAECLGLEKIVVLSGPSHAEEVARMLPASVVAASEQLETARHVQQVFSTPRFRVYASGDIVGVELAGAAKNVIALAAGIAKGMELGDNAMAALITRGIVEMSRLGVAIGADAQTFSGLAGLGDLVTTCISPHGRNRSVGIQLAQGKKLNDILASISGVAEGVTTTQSLYGLAKHIGVDMPIAEQVAAVLWEGKKAELALSDLMTRSRKDEY